MVLQPVVVWFRQDLRLEDNPALDAAVRYGGPIIPVFIWTPEEEGSWAPGAASRWWLHQSLAHLDADLQRCGARLILRQGNSLSILLALARETGAGAVFWNRRYEPAAVARGAQVAAALRAHGLTVESFNAGLLFEPWEVYNKAGKPFQVFTPFWKACLSLPEPPAPLLAPTRLPVPVQWPESVPLARLELEPALDRVADLPTTWSPGAQGAATQIERFLDTALASYTAARDRPDLSGSSRLSPHLHFGEISPRRLWHLVQERARLDSPAGGACGTEVYLRELGWREFAHYVLYHHPHIPEAPWRTAYTAFPWREDAPGLCAWQRGHTGYPLVDAGMRQLWTTGWLPNRVRMVVGSFLVKDLLLPWQEGAKWFWDTLVDADLANNTLGWQWTASCGADATPYFRVFHPVRQRQTFNPHGDYVCRWVPELARLPDAWIHQPWTAPAAALRAARVELGRTYPHPMVDHNAARRRALAALATLRPSVATPLPKGKSLPSDL